LGYERLSREFRDKILAPHWTKHQHRVKEDYGYDLATEGLELRHKFQTDLLWAAHILGYKDFKGKRIWNGIEIDTHQEMADFFLAKDPSFNTFKEFAESITEPHDRLLLVPRGGFKSSMHICDLVQWTVCYADITALILTGVYSLAVDFVGEYSRHFVLQDGTEKERNGPPKWMADGKISLFQVLFPEHCIPPTDFTNCEFTTPARRANLKEPTVRAAGIEQNLSGWHFDLLDLDDVVTNENSLTQTRMQAVNKQININKAMLNPYGFFTKIGTWYDVADTYGLDIKAEESLAAEGLNPSIKILVRPALWLKQEALDRGITDDTAKEDDYILWFPERLTYEFLMKEKRRDQESYAIKYLNNPLLAHQVKFPRPLMIERTKDKYPEQGMIFEAWDLAYSEKKDAKYTVGMAGLFTYQGIYILDMVRGRYGEYELPKVMAEFAYRWKPLRVAVEDSMGARWLLRSIREEQDKYRINVPFEFIGLGKGTKAKSKEVKAKGAANLLGKGALFFWKSMTGLQELYNELEQFPKGQYTDICCSLSLLVNHFGNYAEFQAAPQIPYDERLEKLKYERIYGIGRFAPMVTDQTLISSQGQSVYYDPLADLY